MSDTNNIFNWDAQKYGLQIHSMDREHQVLITLMNQLHQENEKSAPKAQLLKTIEMLGLKTREHFAHEEKYFSGLKDYSLIEPHKIIHQTLLKSFESHVAAFEGSKEVKVPREFFMFLKVWLSAHICGIDKKYAEIANTKVG